MNGRRETTSRRRFVLDVKARTGIEKEKGKNNTPILVFESQHHGKTAMY
jgi:hypothetical protein